MLGERLKRARIKAGLSLDELARKAENIVTKQAISQYEKDQKTPSSSVLIGLSDALGVKIDYFFRKVSVEIGEVDFRKYSNFGKKQQEMLQERVKEELERYIELEQILDLDREFLNPLEDFEINNPEDIENAANEVRKKWNLGMDELPNIMQMIELQDIKVIYSRDDSVRFSGLSGWAWNNERHPFIVLNDNEQLPLDRKRFTAAHELGHLLLGKKLGENSDHERIANRFAGAFLLPKEAIEKELGSSRKHLSVYELTELKRKYKISIQAIMYRLKDLGYLSESRYKGFVISNRKFKYDEQNGLTEEYRREPLNRFQNLLARAYSEELISTNKLAELLSTDIKSALDTVGMAI